MAKNDFDKDFDFEEEYGFDPNEFLDQEEPADIDFSDLDLGEEAPSGNGEADDLGLDDLDLGDLDLGDIDLGMDLGSEDFDIRFDGDSQVEEAFSDEDFDLDDITADADLFEEYGRDEPEVIGGGRKPAPREEEADFDAADFDEEDFESAVYGNPVQQPQYDEQEDSDQPEAPYADEEDPGEADALEEGDELEDAEDAEKEARLAAEQAAREERRKQRAEEKERRRQERKAKREAAGPTVFEKLLKLYLSPAQEPQQDPNNPRRRRRKRSKVQIFKEVYLPPILAGLIIVLMLVFVIGAITNAIERRGIENDRLEKESQAASEEADRQEKEKERVMAEAQLLATGYDYQGAIDTLDTFSGEMPQEMITMRADFQNAQSRLVEYKDYSSIANLSFHMLVADPARAYADKQYGGQYNKNFTTVDEFEKILQQLYDGGYVLVDYDSFTETNTGLDGNAAFFTVPIALPEGKKPIMITETMVNYYGYMVDSNDDDEPDAGGAGFAYRLIVNDQGEIKAQIIDSNGQTQTGNYDLVPILEDFIKEHPDFSYRGARATLAVSGHEGVFGYRINNSMISTKGQTYYDEQVAAARVVVDALRAKGYTIACYTYGDKSYKDMSATQIQADMQEWTNQITPVLGEVDTIVFAKASDIGDYSGPKFEVLYSCGFRYFVKHGTEPYAEVNNSYVRQSRLMVTGENMVWHSDMFKAYFDPAPLLNNTRGNVPKS